MDPKQKILLVDDDPLIERIYSELLRQAGFDVQSVSNAPDAIAAVKASPPSAVLLDLFLPKVNGVEVLKFVRGQRFTRDLPVVAFSTSSTSRYVDAAAREGVTQFLSKEHYKPSDVVAKIQEILEQAKSQAKGADLTELNLAEDSKEKKAFEAIPVLKAELRDRWVALANSATEGRAGKLKELAATNESLLEQSTVAGVNMLRQIFSPMVAFLKGLEENPGNISLSAFRTGNQAIDLSTILCDLAVSLAKELSAPGLIFIASERVASLDVLTAIKRATLTVVSARNVSASLQLCEENRFHAIFWDGDMPGPSASDILSRVRGYSTNKSTPVIFFTKADDFESSTREAATAGFDIIGKPIVPAELAVKAVSYVIRERMNAVSADG